MDQSQHTPTHTYTHAGTRTYETDGQTHTYTHTCTYTHLRKRTFYPYAVQKIFGGCGQAPPALDRCLPTNSNASSPNCLSSQVQKRIRLLAPNCPVLNHRIISSKPTRQIMSRVCYTLHEISPFEGKKFRGKKGVFLVLVNQASSFPGHDKRLE